MKVLILWKQLAGYTSACFHALAATGVAVSIIHRGATPDAPFDDVALTAGLSATAWHAPPAAREICAALEAFAPDVVLVSSWEITAYREAMRAWAGKATRVLCMDNPWLGTLKQWGGRAIARRYIQPSFDLAFVPGERQAIFARRLGFDESALRWGLYSCSERYFRPRQVDECPAGFLFVGRLTESKGVDVLADAYRRYRSRSVKPWPLQVAGVGPGGRLLEQVPGVEMLGFVGPNSLPAVFAGAGCFVLPSRFEPWGVVVHEAAASCLPIIATSAVGASTRLLVDGFNGRLVPPGRADVLAEAMQAMASKSPDELHREGTRSAALASQFTPKRWADYVVTRMGPSMR